MSSYSSLSGVWYSIRYDKDIGDNAGMVRSQEKEGGQVVGGGSFDFKKKWKDAGASNTKGRTNTKVEQGMLLKRTDKIRYKSKVSVYKLQVR